MRERFLTGYNNFVLPFLVGMVFILTYCVVCLVRILHQLPREDSAVAGRMRSMKPQLHDDFVVEVKVENALVEGYMREKQIDLMNYLRTNLRNDFISLRFELMQEDNEQRPVSRVEMLGDMLKNYPALAMLHKELDLELA